MWDRLVGLHRQGVPRGVLAAVRWWGSWLPPGVLDTWALDPEPVPADRVGDLSVPLEAARLILTGRLAVTDPGVVGVAHRWSDADPWVGRDLARWVHDAATEAGGVLPWPAPGHQPGPWWWAPWWSTTRPDSPLGPPGVPDPGPVWDPPQDLAGLRRRLLGADPVTVRVLDPGGPQDPAGLVVPGGPDGDDRLWVGGSSSLWPTVLEDPRVAHWVVTVADRNGVDPACGDVWAAAHVAVAASAATVRCGDLRRLWGPLERHAEHPSVRGWVRTLMLGGRVGPPVWWSPQPRRGMMPAAHQLVWFRRWLRDPPGTLWRVVVAATRDPLARRAPGR